MLPGVVTFYGPPGSAKSTHALSWPKPIAGYDQDNGMDRAWGYQKLVDDGDLIVRRISIPLKSMTQRYVTLEGFTEAWQRFSDSVQADLENPSIKTISVDTGSTLWAMDRDGYMEEVQKESHTQRKQLIEIEYGEPNRRLDLLYNAAKLHKKHLVVTHHETDEYVPVIGPDGEPILDENRKQVSVKSGKKVPEGFRHTKANSDWMLYTYLAETSDGIKPHAVIKKSGYGFDLVNQDIDIFSERQNDKEGLYGILERRLKVLGRL